MLCQFGNVLVKDQVVCVAAAHVTFCDNNGSDNTHTADGENPEKKNGKCLALNKQPRGGSGAGRGIPPLRRALRRRARAPSGNNSSPREL